MTKLFIFAILILVLLTLSEAKKVRFIVFIYFFIDNPLFPEIQASKGKAR